MELAKCLQISILLGFIGAAIACDYGWLSNGDFCYNFVREKEFAFADAVSFCEASGAQLASVDGAAENEWVLGRLSSTDELWIGLARVCPTDVDGDKLRWIDGTSSTFRNWTNSWAVNTGSACAVISRKDSSCSTGLWCRFGDRCFRVFSTKANFAHALRICTSAQNASLASAHSVDENNFLLQMTYAFRKFRSFWIGLKRDDLDEDARWLDGSRVEFENWLEPLDLDGFSLGCTEMIVRETEVDDLSPHRVLGTWSIRRCSNERPFICERQLAAKAPPLRAALRRLRKDVGEKQTSSSPSEDQNPCDSGWLWNSGTQHCYKVAFSALSWQQAQEACEGLGTNLASIESDAENDWLVNVAANQAQSFAYWSSVWLGLAKICPNDTTNEDGLSWIDGSKSTYRGDFTNTTGVAESNCIALCAINSSMPYNRCPKGRWMRSVNCNFGHGYVCKTKPPMARDSERSAEEGPCGRGAWCPLNGGCFRLFLSKKSFEEAEDVCRTHGAHLASFHSETEINYTLSMTDIFTDVDAFHIGLNELNPRAGLEWTDGSPVDYFNWLAGQPDDNNVGSMESCTEMFTRNQKFYQKAPAGQWNDNRCDRQRPFMCGKMEDSMKLPPATTPKTISGNCRPGFIKYSDRCFKLIGGKESERKNFSDAQKQCSKIDGDKGRRSTLASIRNVYEQMFVQSLLRSADFEIWLGMTSTASLSNEFVWIDESRVRYTHWGEAAPPRYFTPYYNQWSHQHWTPWNTTVTGVTGSPYRGSFRGRGHFYQQQSPPGSNDKCVRMSRTGFWQQLYPLDCINLTLGYLCAELVDPTISEANRPDKTENSFCVQGEIAYGNDTCYRLISSAMSWSDAELKCNESGDKRTGFHHLVSITDTFEMAKIVSLAFLNKAIGFSEFWIGLSSNELGNVFQYADNWPVYHALWGVGEPRIGDDRNCVKMTLSAKDAYSGDAIGAEWQTEECLRLLPFVCKSTLVDAPKMELTGSCLRGWREGASACYTIVSNKTSMANAETNFCQRIYNRSHLASFHSAAELQHVIRHSEVTSAKSPVFYIGLQQMMHGGWEWTDGSPTDFVNWAPSEPSNADNPNLEYCTYIDAQGLWHSGDCDSYRSFICMLPKDISIIYDTAQMRFDDDASESGRMGRIVGAAIGVLLAIMFLGAAAFVLLRRSSLFTRFGLIPYTRWRSAHSTSGTENGHSRASTAQNGAESQFPPSIRFQGADIYDDDDEGEETLVYPRT